MGEKIASSYLISKKYVVKEKNYYCHWGELDIVAKKDNKVIFFEVKTRVGTRMGKPYEAINYHKLKDLKRTIQYYLLQKKLNNCKLSLDVISIVLDSNLKVNQLKHFENIIC